MADPFLGEIRMFGGTYAPNHWAFCNGQILQISQYNALYSLLGTAYGGDGRVTFGLPDMRGRIPLHYGTGPGLSPYALGQRGGQEDVTLTTDNMPAHTHTLAAYDKTDSASSPVNGFFGPTSGEDPVFFVYAPPTATIAELHSGTMSQAGSSHPMVNMAPYTCINFIIALQGAYPPRS